MRHGVCAQVHAYTHRCGAVQAHYKHTRRACTLHMHMHFTCTCPPLGLDSGDRLDCLLPLAPTGLDVDPDPHRETRAALFCCGLLPLGLGLPLGMGLGLGLGLLLPLLPPLLALESSPLGPRLRKERLRLRSGGATGSIGSTPSVRGSVG